VATVTSDQPVAEDSDQTTAAPVYAASDQAPSSPDLTRIYLRQIGRVPLLNAEKEVTLAKQIEAGLMAEHVLQTRNVTAAYRRELELIAKQGVDAKQLMLESNLRLVASEAKRYAGRGLTYLDLIQEGNLGLMRAVEKFDYTKGYKFSTYATWWIRQAISRAIADQARTIRLPVHMIELINKQARASRNLLATLGHEPSDERIAAEMGLKPEDVRELRKIGWAPISLDQPVGEGETTAFGELIWDADLRPVETIADMDQMIAAIDRALDCLSPRDARVIRLRYGLADGHPHTLEEIGKDLGVTRERIRQLESKAIAKLRHPNCADTLRAFLSD
jgi:RNA polymerase primary sigma factor